MSRTSRDTWREVTRRLADRAQTAVHDDGTRLLRFEVIRRDPLLLRQIDGDEVLEEGDPDFTIGGWLRSYNKSIGLRSRDVVRVVRDDEEWLAQDVEENTLAKNVPPLAGEGVQGYVNEVGGISLDISEPWGIDGSGRPYFSTDPETIPLAEQAVLKIDDDGTYHLVIPHSP